MTVLFEKAISFFARYKLYHLGFWFLYHYFWWALTSGALEAVNNIFFSNYSIKFVFYVVMQALGVYFNLYYLIPKFLQKGKHLIYIPALLATILVTSFGIIGGYYVNAFIVGIPFQELFYVAPTEFFQLFKANALPSTLASMTLAMSIKLTKNWIASEKKRNAAEKENLTTELKFLRSQYNPHFLFNTINSIFVLIHKNQDMASESLAKFSELLRYQLYQCNAPEIDLEQELNYLKNYIELETLRQDLSNLDLQVALDSSNTNGLQIAPFLLMPFIENAFKHVSHHIDSRNWITIDLNVHHNGLQLEVSNSKPELTITNTEESSGIGLTNVKRRLALLYPNSHKLEVLKSSKEYVVFLDITLKTQVAKNSKTA
ncbi:histidine kinase [Croceitalea sp. MTPC5]|uniref:sensor histidine kinase n=1 Tax=Croceitalea sp. MTPC5 TaxID=3056565 RepID=UPI002B371A5E|nr:histidine kinase [Croceitalea sp. MTPC5]